MNGYKWGMFVVVCAIIAAFSVLLGHALGIIGLLLPSLLVTLAYLLVYTIIAELEHWSRHHFPPYSNSG